MRTAITALLSLVLVACVYGHKGHTCIHDKKVEEQNKFLKETDGRLVTQVDYNHGSLFSIKQTDNHKPIRIFVDTSSLTPSNAQTCAAAGDVVNIEGQSHTCGKSDVLTTAKLNFLKTDLLPNAVKWFARALKVVPVTGNLKIRPFGGGSRCGTRNDYVEVPASHQLTGAGVPDADFILYTKAQPTLGSTIAWALACAVDQNDRPIAGLSNFGPGQLSTDAAEYDVQLSTAIHEIAHTFGFSSSFVEFWRKPDGVTKHAITQRTSTERGNTVVKIITPHVADAVAAHFDCPNMANPGAEFEDAGGSGTAGSHLEKRLFRNEFMTGTASQIPVYSNISLALFADMGWYRVEWKVAERLLWGYREGCNFAQSKCTTWDKEFFCDTKDQQGCTHDTLAKGFCNLATFSTSLPGHFQYIPGSPTSGGRDQYADFCPFFQGYSNGDCRVAANRQGRSSDARGEMFGPGSRCFVSTMQKEEFGAATSQGMCYGHRCTNDGAGMDLQIDGKWYPCPPAGGPLKVPGYVGEIICLPAKEHCLDGTDEQTRQHNCPGECTINGACVNGTCICKAGWTGLDCSMQACPNSCSGNGDCNAETGKCICTQPWKGADCSVRDTGCPSNCTSPVNGACNTETGRCTCNSGYMGAACEIKSSVPTCPNSCSGRGVCSQDLKCRCNEPWFGDDCASRQCPFNCSDRGTCDTTTGTCTCEPGWSGCGCTEESTARLQHNDRITQYGTRVGEYEYYRIFVPSANATLTVNVNSSIGADADLYISRTREFPTASSHTWKSDNVNPVGQKGVDQVVIDGSGMLLYTLSRSLLGTYLNPPPSLSLSAYRCLL
eukprot:TRINITY_DN2690_c0_g1_i15.p1 TRINITY_DN2690_c0_g1~~TRINITY_DN2690_c0_g1_i15.p1  ORF type:complete len:831 (-),score=166.25 TRINITY_DN2690_c0_g1_i15:672-3164(-)